MKNKILSLLTLAVLLSACTNTPTETSADVDLDSDIEVAGNEKPDTAMEEKVGFTFELKKFAFTPNVFEVKAGTTVKIKIVNAGGIHDFVIDELDVKSSQIKEGEEEIFEITIPEDAKGKEYEFYCSVGNHRQQGMVGTLTVL